MPYGSRQQEIPMKRFLMVAAISMMASSALAQTAPQEFVDKAASSGMYEIQSSEIVLTDPKADADVKAFAKQMIADHTKAAGDLKTAATKSGLAVPMTMMTKHEAMVGDLNQATDKLPLYKKQQLDAHEEAVALHESYGSAGTDPNLKMYADMTSPVLKKHLEHIKMLNETKTLTGAPASTDTTSDDINKNAEGVDTSTAGGQGTGSGTSTAAPAN
jgi:putative membrane protein